MVTQGTRTIETDIPNGPKVKWLECWDYKANLEEISFKTKTLPPIQNPLLEAKEMDMLPVQNFKFWQVTIRRYPKHNVPPNKKHPI